MTPTATGVSLIPGVQHGNGKVIVSFTAATSTALAVTPVSPAAAGSPETRTATVTPRRRAACSSTTAPPPLMAQ